PRVTDCGAAGDGVACGWVEEYSLAGPDKSGTGIGPVPARSESRYPESAKPASANEASLNGESANAAAGAARRPASSPSRVWKSSGTESGSMAGSGLVFDPPPQPMLPGCGPAPGTPRGPMVALSALSACALDANLGARAALI